MSGPARRSRRHPGIIALGALAALAGVLVLALAGGVLASVLGAALLGLSAITFVALAFLLVGEGEERDRLRHPHG
jgi:drug/metabolite transporter (DMT)-like permease